MDERRVARRANTAKSGIQTRVALSDGTILSGSVSDLSAGGAAITGETEGLGLDRVVNVAFVFPAGRQITYNCLVRHIEPGKGFGVQYVQ